ncbi:sphingomyelin phosphodiesterase-like [Oppia nitens]|uniref:sphingomyelin phosphodiesterase-like n=1 Tax=Oppia nitens TaxID=1686743 RepID=UPI0023D9E256|nr:sphingomyelin phosphodiesterase-like [Oppia nitens]
MNLVIKIQFLLYFIFSQTNAHIDESVHNFNFNDVSLDTPTLDDLGKLFLKLMSDFGQSHRDSKSCLDCNKTLTYLREHVKSGQQIRDLAESTCKTATSPRVCRGNINIKADPMVYIIKNSKLTVQESCSAMMHPDCMTHLKAPVTKWVNWELPLPKPKPFTPKTVGTKQLKMLHLTDAHLDLWYTPGSNSRCNEPVCCRSTSPGHNHSAGYWSETSYSCDTPLSFAETALEHMSVAHRDIDFVIWTGDNIPHDTWNTTEAVNLKHVKYMTDLVKKAFPGKLVFPSLGNHEPHPPFMFVPHEVEVKTNGSFSMSWLYDTLADSYWSQWISTPAAKQTFKKGGYFAAPLNADIKLIVLNNAICWRPNYWIAYDPYDPDGQLQWLINELDSAESDGKYAIIIGHIPFNECYPAWTNNYFRIMERYQQIVVGNYVGHTHTDEILVMLNKNTRTNETYPVGHAYLGSSMTTFSGLFPGYRVFTLENTGKPIDFLMYYSNVTEDNLMGKDVTPKWTAGYSAKQSYNLKSLSTEDWNNFIIRAKTDDSLTKTYYERYYRFSDAFLANHKHTIQDMRNILQNKRVVNPLYL